MIEQVFVGFHQRHVAAGGDVDEEAGRTFDVDVLEERRGYRHARGVCTARVFAGRRGRCP